MIAEGSAPPEMPVQTVFVSLQNAFAFPLGDQPYAIGLYDGLGRIVDLVRTNGRQGQPVHNHPRLPSAWSDYRGVARRDTFTVQRTPIRVAGDSDQGDDWAVAVSRTMGSFNGVPAYLRGESSAVDVRVNGTPGGQGLFLAITGGPALAFHRYGLMPSLGHADGTGPFLGLGPDAFGNWFLLRELPPFGGFLDARGGARIDLPAPSLPAGFAFDLRVVIESPLQPGSILEITPIVEGDA